MGEPIGQFEAIIGLEIHVQLNTATKLFCGCPNRFGAPPNTHTCPVCLGMPGALPVLNAKAVRYALRTALALGCRINLRSRFARKNYFYPDLPKGYQISQYEQPLAEDGSFAYDLEGERRGVRIVRVHLEEDAGKSVHEGIEGTEQASYVDLNRCGVPLIEVVTSPDLRSPEEAHAFLTTLRTTLLYLGVTDANMEEGSLRCDANVSVRRQGESKLQPKTEVKNLNSFRFLRQALRHELERQVEVLASGGSLTLATRLWDERDGKTVPMREKEEAHDYRYFPEPDLVPVVLSQAEVEEAEGALPELPLARLDRFVADYAIPVADAGLLVQEKPRAELFEATVAAGADPRAVSKWMGRSLLRWENETGGSVEESPLTAGGLAALLGAIEDGTVSGNTAEEVLAEMLDSGAQPAAIITRRGLQQISAADDLAPVVEEILQAHPEEVAAYRSGRQQVFGYLMGQVMRATAGKANPKVAQQLLRSQLEG